MSLKPCRLALAALLIVSEPSFAHNLQQGAPAAAASELPAPNLHLKGGLWFDGAKFRRMEWYSVGGKLTARRPARVDATVDLSGRHVIPPLAEAHNHDLQSAWAAPRSNRAYLSRGIFYSGQMGASPDDIRPFRGLLGTPGSVDAAFAEALISASDGHPLGMALDSYKAAGMEKKPEEIRDRAYWAVDSVADLEARWERIAAAKPKLIKIMLIDSANYEANRKNSALFGKNGLDPALVPEIVRRARGIGARVIAHAETADDFTRAVAGGADIIAHLPGYKIGKGKSPADYRLADAAIAEAARRGVTVITTTAVSRFAIKQSPDLAAPINGNYADNIGRLRAAGVPIAFGSDDFEGSVLDEIETVDRLKVIPRADLLRIATQDTPRLLFPDRRIGAFAEGAEASLVALEGNPIEDISVLRRPRLAIKQGELLATR
jgi:hypothetical protein